MPDEEDQGWGLHQLVRSFGRMLMTSAMAVCLAVLDVKVLGWCARLRIKLASGRCQEGIFDLSRKSPS